MFRYFYFVRWRIIVFDGRKDVVFDVLAIKKVFTTSEKDGYKKGNTTQTDYFTILAYPPLINFLNSKTMLLNMGFSVYIYK